MKNKLLFLIFTICLSACEWAGTLQAQTSRTAYIDTMIVKGEFEEGWAAVKASRNDRTLTTEEQIYLQVKLLRIVLEIGDSAEKKAELKKAEKYLAAYSGPFKDEYLFLYYVYGSSLMLAEDKSSPKALDFLTKAEELAKSLPKDYTVALMNTKLGKYYLNNGEYQKSLNYYKKNLTIYSKDLVNYALTLNNIGVAYDYLNNLPLALKYYKESIELREKVLRPDHPQIADGYYNIAGIQTTLAQFDEAKKSFEKSMTISQKAYKDDKVVIAELYNAMGELHFDLEEYDIAESLWLKAVKSYGASPGRPLALKNLATLYFNTYRKYLAKPVIIEAITILEQNKEPEHVSVLDAKLILARLHAAEQKNDIAQKMLIDLIAVCKKHGDSHKELLAAAILEQARNQLAQNPSKVDEQLILEAFNINTALFGPNCFSAVDCAAQLAQYYQALGDTGKANKWAWETLKRSSEDYSKSTWPTAEQLHFPELVLQALKVLSNQSGQPLIQIYKLGDGLISQSRQRMLVGTDKQIFSKSARDFYDQCFDKFAKKQNLELAFECAEKAKSMVMLEHISAEKGRQSIPGDIAEKEKNILGKIGGINTMLHHIPESDPILAQKYRADLAVSLHELKNLRDLIRNKYPEYYDLKYGQPMITASSTVQHLPEGTDMLYYHISGDNLAIFQLCKHKPVALHWKKGVADISALVQKNRKAIESNNLIEYKETSARLGKLLVMIFYQSGELPKRLMIVPDKFLWQVPFDLLLSEPSNEKSWRSLNYLVRNTAISYQFGASTWAALKETSQTARNGLSNNSFAGYACSYGNQLPSAGRSLTGKSMYLPNAKQEIQKIQKQFDKPEVVTGIKIDKKALMERIPKADVVHLAMHAYIDPNFPDYSKLLLSTDTASTDASLHLREIYYMPMQASLLTLSACNTGSGEFQDGEGVASLAKGFTQAGARSVAYTQWFLSDEASPRLMELFYENLKKDMGKDEALQKAKLTFLQECDGPLSAPVFWGSFAISGDIGQLPRKNKVHTKKIFLGTLFTVLGLVALGTKRFW